MSQPISLAGLTPREAIADAVYRCVAGLDNNNRELFESAFTKEHDLLLEVTGRDPIHGLDGIMSNVYKVVEPLDTQHIISNVRIDAKPGARAAYLASYVLAHHYRGGEGFNPASTKVLSGTQYLLDVVEDSDGVWRVKTWRIKVMWLDGDMSVMQSGQS